MEAPIKKGLIATGMILAGAVSGGIIPAAWGAVAAAITGAAALFHEKPKSKKECPEKK